MIEKHGTARFQIVTIYEIHNTYTKFIKGENHVRNSN
jgi:hypothetical protein